MDARARPETTARLTRGACRLLEALGYAPLAEAMLPNGRRADLMGLSPRGEIVIVEVKSCLEDFTADDKWSEYRPWCDRFFFAVSEDFPQPVLPECEGLMVVDAFGGAVLRDSAPVPCAPARRKALTLAFARAAALRALRV